MKILKFIIRWFFRLVLFALFALIVFIYGVLIRNRIGDVGLSDFITAVCAFVSIFILLIMIVFGCMCLYVWSVQK